MFEKSAGINNPQDPKKDEQDKNHLAKPAKASDRKEVDRQKKDDEYPRVPKPSVNAPLTGKLGW